MWHKTTGEGQPVVLLHGATGSPESYWAPQIPVLAEHFNVILMQYPGYGAEDDDAAEFSIPGSADALARLLDDLGVERVKEGWRSIDVPRYTAMLRSILAWSIDDRLHEIQAPALVVWGSEDIELPRVYSERIASALPHAVMTVIEGAGHKSCSDLPEQFNKAVLAFL